VMDDVLFDQSVCPLTDEKSRSSRNCPLRRCYCELAALSISAFSNTISNLGTETARKTSLSPGAEKSSEFARIPIDFPSSVHTIAKAATDLASGFHTIERKNRNVDTE
jgi:hypothetical protein